MDAARLKKIPVFADLDDDARRTISLLASEVSIPEGKELVSQGDYSYQLLAIEEGSAKVERDGEQIAELGPGDFIGEIGVLERGQRNATVTSTSPMVLVTLDRWDVKRLQRQAPAVIEHLKELVAARAA
ncbi:MAG TPA: cyclic nucleotide-binding domain-containing protein, partial [Solirubrobacteraceae bacterium]